MKALLERDVEVSGEEFAVEGNENGCERRIRA